MSRGYRFWVDTETTGFSLKFDQVLELAALVEDADGEEVERVELKIKLKQNVTPGPVAILINKINPYSKKWAQGSITENSAAQIFADLAKKYTTTDGIKPTFTAYNADFDKSMCSVMLSRSGMTFSHLFNKSVFDPLKTARRLTTSGRLKTTAKFYGGRETQSAALGDVAKALGIEFEGDAHRAMADVVVMRKVTAKLFELATGHPLKGLSSNPSSYQVGQVVKIVTDSKSSGAIVRHVLILENSIEKDHIIAIDEEDIKLNKGFKDTSVRQFNYGTIIGDMAADENVARQLNAVYREKAEEILALSKKKLKGEPDNSPEFDEDSKDFGMIEQVQRHLSKAEDKKAAFAFIYKELLARFGGDPMSAKAVLTRAENLACAKGLTGWSKELFFDEKIRMLENILPGMQFRVALHPGGYYSVGLAYEKDGRPAKELKDCKAKKDIQSFLNAKIGKVPEMVTFVESLPNVEVFTDPKHPAVIETEVLRALDEIAVKGASDDVKAGIAELLKKLQVASPKIFSKYKIPIDPVPINEEKYWQADFAGTSDTLISPLKLVEKARPQDESNAKSDKFDHVKPGDKLARTPCALCGRALSANISVQHSMGPTCRRNLAAAEDADGPLEPYREPYRPFSVSSAPKAGDLYAVRCRDHVNSETEVLAEFVSVNTSQTQLIDRRKIRRLLKAGINPNFAVYLSTMKFPPGTISGIAKLKPSPSEEDSHDHSED
jgi:DNA polymerase III epsilon subunit-like protein